MELVKCDHAAHIIESLKYGILSEDIDRKIISANSEFINILNIPLKRENLIGLDCTLLADQVKYLYKNQNYFLNFINSCIENKKTINAEFELTNNRFVDITYIPYIHENQFLGHNWCFNDVTEETKNKKALKEKDSFYKNILNFIPADIAVFDADHKYLFINEYAIKDNNLREWLIGKTDFDYCNYRNINNDLAIFRKEQFNIAKTKKAAHSWEDRKINNEGETEVILRVLNPFLNESNNVEMVIGYGLDITKSKSNELHILREATKNKILLDNLKQTIFELTSDGKTISLNPAWLKLSGKTIKTSLDIDFVQFILEEEKQNIFIEYLTNSSKKELNLKFTLPTELINKVIKGFFSKTFDENNNVNSIWGTLIDETEKDNYQNNLINLVKKEQELNELKTRFVHMVSHEVRTPLAGILSSIELLEILNTTIPKKLKDNNYRHFSRIKSQILRISDLMNNVLLLGKIESGNFKANIEETDIIDKINTLLNENFNFDSESKIKFIYTGNPYFVLLDWKLIYHVIVNLLSNSIKYTKSSKKPEIHANFETKDFKLSIKDYGIGIPEKEIQNLFNPFSRASNVENISGTGLGLILVKSLVELNNGKIDIISKENVGSTFTITFNNE